MSKQAEILSGKEIGQQIRESLQADVAELMEKGVKPGLAVVLVGNHPASESYVKGKIKACEEVGLYSELHRLAETVTEEELLKVVNQLNNDPSIDGILVQLPLPKHINADLVNQAISPNKDVDGFTPVNVGRMHIGEECFLPCTPHGVMKMIEKTGVSVKGKHAVVIGRSNIVGKPMAMLLLAAGATVTICHSQTQDLAAFTKQADFIIAAVGKPKFVTADMVKPGASVYDVGINRVEGKLVGDVDFEGVSEVADYLTPVPGGVGPMTITMLLWNTVLSAKRAYS